jgi:hypothetical protein
VAAHLVLLTISLAFLTRLVSMVGFLAIHAMKQNTSHLEEMRIKL